MIRRCGMEISNLYMPSRCLRLDSAQSVRRFSVYVFASELKFYVTKSRSRIKCIGALASRRTANRSEPMKIRMPHAPEISVALKIFGARTRPPSSFETFFECIDIEDTWATSLHQIQSPHQEILSSHESSAGKHVFRIRVSLRYVAPVCSRANTRDHAKEIACYSSI